MKIVPVNFNTEHKIMLGHCKMILESEGGRIAINPVFNKLITSLRTPVDNDGTLDKESTSYHDIFDAFRKRQGIGSEALVRRAKVMMTSLSDLWIWQKVRQRNDDELVLLLLLLMLL